MRLLNALDTRIFQTKYIEYCNEYGMDNIYAFRKSKMYFWVHIVPGILGVILALIFLFVFKSQFNITFSLVSILGVLAVILLIVLDISLVRKYLNYRCDFTIITPLEIICFDQLGVFKRKISAISKEKISSISTIREGFIQNIFNTGTLVISILGGTENSEMKIKYVFKPDATREKIMAIIHANKA